MRRDRSAVTCGKSPWRRRSTQTLAVLLALCAVGVSGILLGHALGWTNADITQSKWLRGYATPCRFLPPPVFTVEGWTGVVLDADIAYTDGAHNVVFWDLDADGRLEIVANSFRSDALMFYRCDGEACDPNRWTRHVVGLDVGGGCPTRPIRAYAQSWIREDLLGGCTGGAHCTAISDVSGDGIADLVVAGDLKKCDIVCYEAPAQSLSSSSWTRHCVYRNDSHRTYQVDVGDLDGDGDSDVVFVTKDHNSLGWCQNNGSSSAWPATWIATGLGPCFQAGVADLDRDARNEVIATQDCAVQGGRLWRFTCSGDPRCRTDWKAQVIAEFPLGHGASVFELVDFDQDGDADIFLANHQGDVFLIRSVNAEGQPLEWAVHRLNAWDAHRGHSFRELDVGDIDGDGDLDVVLADEHLDLLMWLENPGPSVEPFWSAHVVDKSRYYLLWCHSVDLGDVDGDGDLDIAVAACGGNVILLYLNHLLQDGPRDGWLASTFP